MRALQPPLLGFVQQIVPVEKWDAATTRSRAKKQAIFMIVMSGISAIDAVLLLFDPRLTSLGVAWLAVAVLNASFAFMNFRSFSKRGKI